MASIVDTQAQVANMKKATSESIRDIFPIVGKDRELRLNDVWVADERDRYDFVAQKNTKLKGRSYATPIYANLELVDKHSGKVIDSVDKLKLAELPVLTPRNSFIVKGNEYQVTNQLRLRPGVYTKFGADGSLSSQVNLAKGRNFKVFLDQEKGLFKIHIGTSNVKLYPILRDLGVSDAEIEKAWGEELLDINRTDASGVMDTEINKLYKNLFFRQSAENREEAVSNIKDYMKNGTRLDEKITEFTLGTAHDRVSPQMLMDTTKKLLAVSRNEQDEDDRDHLAFKSVHSVDDFLAERLSKSAGKITADLVRGVDKLGKKKIAEIVPRDSFNKPIESLFTQTQLSSTPEQINPMHMVAGLQKVTLFGEGGISERALTAEARGVHPSHLGLLDPIQTPESGAVGAMFRLPNGVRKTGDVLKAVVYDPITAKTKELSAREMHDQKVAFPDQFDLKDGKFKPVGSKVVVQHEGEIKEVSPAEVDSILSTPKGLFGFSVNMIPFLDSDQGNRSLTASRMQEQALPLVNREQPLVQVEVGKIGSGVSYEESLAKDYRFVAKSPESGTVSKIDEDGVIHIKPEKGREVLKVHTYKDFPLNAKHFFDSELKVKVGDKVKANQILADTNYTKDGKLALGTNLNVAYTPYRGYNYEDGIVISDSAAQKLTSMHMYKEAVKTGQDIFVDKQKFRARFPSKFTADQLNHVDEGGVVKKGTVVSEGDPLILALGKNTARPEDNILRNINKSLIQPFRDLSIVWEKTVPGEVTEIARYGPNVEVYVRTKEPAVVGDKLAGRHGNKGIIVKVIPDGDMPRTKDGQPMDVLMNPNGVPSRINLGQLLETSLGKVAHKKGEPMLIQNFEKGSNVDKVKKLLKENNLTDTEELYDGKDGKKLGDISAGKQFIMKLDHSVSKKFSARDTGGYTADEIPGRGGDGGAQSIDPLLFYALISHGATENLAEMASVKGTKNDEFWRAYQLGHKLPVPKPSFAFEKFEGLLKGLGVDVKKKGNEFSLVPMTDKDVENYSSGAITNAGILKVTGKSALEPEKGGVFDPQITGGHGGNKWAHINLSEPMPNPLFEDAIKTVLGVKQNDYDGIIAGKVKVDNKTGEISKSGTLSGGRALRRMLANIDVDSRIEAIKKDAIGTKGQKLNTFNKEIRYLKALKNNGLSPETAYVVDKLPVIPPKFRPIYPLDNGSLITSDANILYKDVFLANEALGEKKDLGLPEEALAEDRAHLYEQQKALLGLGGVADSAQVGKRPPAGLLETITGRGSPKGSFFQAKLIGKRQDISGRSTIIPEPRLSVDEVGVPKKMLTTIYRKPVIRRLVQLGYTPLQAKEELDKESKVAMKALELETESRPVMLNRAPTLHKFGMMAFKPKITKGKAIKLHPLVVKGYNADFDGDTMALHAPVTDAAVKEAFKLMPTNNLFNPGTGDLMVVPGQEAVLGLYNLTEAGKQTKLKYDNFGKVQEDLKAGKIEATDVMSIGGVKTTPGRYLVNMLLPEEHRKFDEQLNKKRIVSLMKSIANTHPKEFGQIADGLKDVGNEHAYRSGATISLKDIDPLVEKRNEIFARVAKESSAIDRQLEKAKSKKEREELKQKKVELYSSITPDIDRLAGSLPKSNNVFRMANAGARGTIANIRQMVVAPVLLTDTTGAPVPVPVKKSYAEGLDTAGYFIQSYGARKGAVDRSMQTAVPGYFSKRIINSMIDLTVTMPDCGTSQGIEADFEDALDRYTVDAHYGFPKNTLVTSRVVSRYKQAKKDKIKVRTPMYCEAKEGICAKCFGKRETGQDSSIGDNIGTISAQAIAEPATQMQMRTFHTGGVAAGGVGANLKSGFERILQMTELPATIRGAAVLSEEDGRVDQITPAPAGGFFVHVAAHKHYVPANQKVVVEEGQEIEKGDPLSTGEQNPHDILRLKGVDYTKKYLSQEIKKEYNNQGIKLKPNIVDTMVRSLTNLTRIDDPGETDYAPGDYAPLSVVESKIKEGHNITHRPELKGINQVALYGNEDWISHLNFQGLKKTVLNAAAKGWTSSIHGTNPIAAWAYGAEFGKGDKPGTY